MPTLQHQFGRKLRSLRLAHEWTQEELAERLAVSVNFLSYMERGIKAPSFPNLERIANVFEVSVAVLFEISVALPTAKRVRRSRSTHSG